MKERDIVNIITQCKDSFDEIISFIVISLSSLWWIKRGYPLYFEPMVEFSKWIWSNRSYIHWNTIWKQRNIAMVTMYIGNIMTMANEGRFRTRARMRRIVWLNIGGRALDRRGSTIFEPSVHLIKRKYI